MRFLFFLSDFEIRDELKIPRPSRNLKLRGWVLTPGAISGARGVKDAVIALTPRPVATLAAQQGPIVSIIGTAPRPTAAIAGARVTQASLNVASSRPQTSISALRGERADMISIAARPTAELVGRGGSMGSIVGAAPRPFTAMAARALIPFGGIVEGHDAVRIAEDYDVVTVMPDNSRVARSADASSVSA